ncbi:MAG: membrane protein insertion efficiency factor YidD, partial [Schleiferiaceae bacterium]
MRRALTWLISAPMLALIGIYKYVISPLTPPSCRHSPTCSSYAGEAVREWG